MIARLSQGLRHHRPDGSGNLLVHIKASGEIVPKDMPNAIRFTGIRNLIEILSVFWVITHPSNVQRGNVQRLPVPFTVEERHAVRVIGQDLCDKSASIMIRRSSAMSETPPPTNLSAIRQLRRPCRLLVISGIRLEDTKEHLELRRLINVYVRDFQPLQGHDIGRHSAVDQDQELDGQFLGGGKGVLADEAQGYLRCH